MSTPSNNSNTPGAATAGLDPRLLVLRREILTYRRELPRLLAEGHEGRFVLIQGDQVIGLWDSFEEAYEAGRERFGFGPCLAQPLDPRDLTRTFPRELDPAAAG